MRERPLFASTTPCSTHSSSRIPKRTVARPPLAHCQITRPRWLLCRHRRRRRVARFFTRRPPTTTNEARRPPPHRVHSCSSRSRRPHSGSMIEPPLLSSTADSDGSGNGSVEPSIIGCDARGYCGQQARSSRLVSSRYEALARCSSSRAATSRLVCTRARCL